MKKSISVLLAACALSAMAYIDIPNPSGLERSVPYTTPWSQRLLTNTSDPSFIASVTNGYPWLGLSDPYGSSLLATNGIYNQIVAVSAYQIAGSLGQTIIATNLVVTGAGISAANGVYSPWVIYTNAATSTSSGGLVVYCTNLAGSTLSGYLTTNWSVVPNIGGGYTTNTNPPAVYITTMGVSGYWYSSFNGTNGWTIGNAGVWPPPASVVTVIASNTVSLTGTFNGSFSGAFSGTGGGITSLSWLNITNPPAFQPASINLTNWGALSVTVVQPASANLTNWSSIPVASVQPASTNLNAWSLIPTNTLLNTNIQFTFGSTRTNTLYFTNGLLVKITQP